METWRAYFNKSNGNEHVRVDDFEAENEADARSTAAKLTKRGEVVGDVVRIHLEEHTTDSTATRVLPLETHLKGGVLL